MTTTSIEWTQNPDGTPGRSWNPLRGCSRISPGCMHCYAESIARRFSGPDRPFHGLIDHRGRWNGKILQAPEATLLEPSTWRKPTRVFVNSMTDLFHENVPDGWIDQIFAVMARFREHTYIVLTKRADRMREYLTHPDRQWKILAAAAQLPPCGMERLRAWPLPHVWLGVSVEDQERAEERIPELLRSPAAVRFLSCEPLLGPVDLRGLFHCCSTHDFESGFCVQDCGDWQWLGWVIVGGESGPGARSMNLCWAKGIVQDCHHARVPCFVKQLGAKPGWPGPNDRYPISDRKGAVLDEWPAELRVRQWPREVSHV